MMKNKIGRCASGSTENIRLQAAIQGEWNAITAEEITSMVNPCVTVARLW